MVLVGNKCDLPTRNIDMGQAKEASVRPTILFIKIIKNIQIAQCVSPAMIFFVLENVRNSVRRDVRQDEDGRGRRVLHARQRDQKRCKHC